MGCNLAAVPEERAPGFLSAHPDGGQREEAERKLKAVRVRKRKWESCGPLYFSSLLTPGGPLSRASLAYTQIFSL